MSRRKQGRELFNSHVGVVLSCVGAAMGLANVWLFPGRLVEFGGVTFLIPYFIFLFGLSRFGLMGEYAFGKTLRCGPVRAFARVCETHPSCSLRALRGSGWFPVGVLLATCSFYVVIIGWILRYVVLSCTNALAGTQAHDLFYQVAGTSANVPWTLAAIALTACVVSVGVQKGVERGNIIMMVLFYGVLAFITGYIFTLPNAWIGMRRMLAFQSSSLCNPRLWLYALGMSFFSLSLGGAAMVLYGSYMPDTVDIPRTAFQTVTLDFLASGMSALCLIPSAWVLGMDVSSGPEFLFVTITRVASQIPMGVMISVLFFLCVLCAALSSAIAMLEVILESFVHTCTVGRRTLTWSLALVVAFVSLPLNASMRVFETFTDIVVVILSPLSALMGSVMIFWVYGAERCRVAINRCARGPLGKWFTPYMRYVYLGLCVMIMVLGVMFGGF
ncbi:probable NSS family amino acid:sodium (Na+) symporter [Treponema paraluiscuniculi Cuniculi A]|uniref:Probable NSS family amino acid:sodium (Na+) symporter n=2 Tax=Treponema paraluiscuniculi TaxID=53435 RepID=F7XRL5_TREPU|nr:sodium-dependent transporter [Treponema paraluiscuniculi]AEH39977.1 probable NSS family amino acid:sodium (Na+) symporter [Treponema paraluiscuniculi Cuniculi A]WKC71910.1 NSS family probable amino acid:sodium (Na+) symporter [Treponema paraluiscuniculi]